MPGAVAGATLLARDLLGEEISEGDEGEGHDEGDGPGGARAPEGQNATP